MSDLYRIDPTQAWFQARRDSDKDDEEFLFVIDEYRGDVGRLVPVERCEHGWIDPHMIGGGPGMWLCLGSPTLRKADDE